MKKTAPLFILLALLVLVGVSSPAIAHEDEAQTAEAVLEEEAVTAADLGVAEPTLLPSSPFYFWKTFTRALKSAFTFNPVKKAELELRFADEKLLEANKLAETDPGREEALTRALENYRTSQERLHSRIEALRETSENPNVDRLLEELTERMAKHERLFAELEEKFGERTALKEKLNVARADFTALANAAAKKDRPEEFAKRLEQHLIEAKGSAFKHVRAVELLDRLEGTAEGELKERVAAARQEFIERFRQDIDAFLEEHEATGQDAVREVLEKLPGDKARRLEMLAELRERLAPEDRSALDEASEHLEAEVGERPDAAAHAQEAVRRARELLTKLEALLAGKIDAPAAVRELANQAKAHLARAEEALAAKKFGEALGQARSAEVMARNALRTLEHERPEAEDLKEGIAEFEEKLGAWEARIAGLNPELQLKAKEALETARFHLRLAAETLAQGQLREAKRHLEEAKGALRLLERIAAGRARIEIEDEAYRKKLKDLEECGPQPGAPGNWVCRDGAWMLIESREPRETVCTQQFDPVCGADGKTYSNACHARVAGAVIKHRGACSRLPPVDEPPQKPIEGGDSGDQPVSAKPLPPAPAVAEFTVEADDAGFYPSNSLSVPRGARVRLTFVARSSNVYFGGLDFRSAKFKTSSVRPGGSTAVEFTADDDLLITSYWPASGQRKADLRIVVKD